MTIRRAAAGDAAAIAAVHVACWREAYAGVLQPAFLAALDVSERTHRWRGILGGAMDAGTFVALDAGRIVGFASGCPQRTAALAEAGYAGEIATIYVLQQAQRRGLGRSLMARLAEGMLAAGLDGAALWVFEANLPARRFYEALGGQPCGRQTTDIAGQAVREVAYGWPDLRRLCRPPDSR
jgi:GNAT superfamily N-acetyltransferase